METGSAQVLVLSILGVCAVCGGIYMAWKSGLFKSFAQATTEQSDGRKELIAPFEDDNNLSNKKNVAQCEQKEAPVGPEEQQAMELFQHAKNNAASLAEAKRQYLHIIDLLPETEAASLAQKEINQMKQLSLKEKKARNREREAKHQAESPPEEKHAKEIIPIFYLGIIMIATFSFGLCLMGRAIGYSEETIFWGGWFGALLGVLIGLNTASSMKLKAKIEFLQDQIEHEKS